MSIKQMTELGTINVTTEAIATLTGGVVSECYGVVGMSSQKFFKDGLSELLKKNNYSKGIVVRDVDGELELDIYIIVSFGVRISEVVHEVQKKVKYTLESTLDLRFNHVNVFVQGVKEIK